MGPYKNTGAEVVGLVARENHVYGNGIGVKFTNVRDGTVTHSVIHGNRKDGILYSGSNATIFNNLLYANGSDLTGENGITFASGNNHQITNNTVYGNYNSGIRLGTSATAPVFSTVLNNIVAQNQVGIREPAGSGYTGKTILNYNHVYNNSGGNYVLSKGSGSAPAPTRSPWTPSSWPQQTPTSAWAARLQAKRPIARPSTGALIRPRT